MRFREEKGREGFREGKMREGFREGKMREGFREGKRRGGFREGKRDVFRESKGRGWGTIDLRKEEVGIRRVWVTEGFREGGGGDIRNV